jgi:hypothetical protein
MEQFNINDRVKYSGLFGIVKGVINHDKLIIVKFDHSDDHIACLQEYAEKVIVNRPAFDISKLIKNEEIVNIASHENFSKLDLNT